MNTESLREFLIYCGKEGYATMQDADEQNETDHSTSITLTRGAWKFHDNYFGGEPYGGREVVFYESKPVWIMVYYGSVIDIGQDLSQLYGHLKKSLALVPDEAPYRGPREFSEGDWRYTNTWNGDIDDFSGEEIISFQGEKVYSARYTGGFVSKN